MTTKTEQEMREAFKKAIQLWCCDNSRTIVEPEFQDLVARCMSATASAEAKYLPVIEKLVGELVECKYYAPEEIEAMADEALAEAAPLFGEKK